MQKYKLKFHTYRSSRDKRPFKGLGRFNVEDFKNHTRLANKTVTTKFIFIKNLKSVGKESISN